MLCAHTENLKRYNRVCQLRVLECYRDYSGIYMRAADTLGATSHVVTLPPSSRLSTVFIQSSAVKGALEVLLRQ